MWGGSREDFFRLYEIASKHLKACFPDILVGGYGSCGFYPLTRSDLPESYQSFMTWFTDFLQMCRETGAPMDFYSWHIYTNDENELMTHARYVRETLDAYGFPKAEAHLNEWNIGTEGTSFTAKHTMEGGSFSAAVLCLLQNTHYVDKAMYYCFSLQGRYNGLLDQNDDSTSPSWYPFAAFGKLYALGNSAPVQAPGDGLYAAAAFDAQEAAVLLVNYRQQDETVTLDAKGLPGGRLARVLRITQEQHLDESFACTVSSEATLRLHLPGHTAVLITFSDPSEH